MRRINLENYTVTMKVPDGGNPYGERIEAEFPNNVKDSIINVLFTPELRLGGAEIIKQQAVALKIESSNGNVTLEDAEYERVKNAFDNFKGFNRNDVQLVERIDGAEVVEIT